MAIRSTKRRGERRLVIDILYRTPDGAKARYRHDAEVQTWPAARAEERRRLAALAATGSPYEVIDKEARAQVMPEPPCGPTFGEVASLYEKDYLPTCKPSTAANYPYTIRRWLLPSLEGIAIADVDYEKALAIQNAARAKGVSSGRVRTISTVLRSILRFAVERGLLAERPKMPKLPPKGRLVLSTYKDHELRAMLKAANHRVHRLAIMLAAFAGLRACEIRGLRGMDIDLPARTITVRWAVSVGKMHKPKSGHERVVPILDELYAELEAFGPIGKSDLVAPNAHGERWGQHGLFDLFGRIAKRAGVTTASRFVHNLRHYFGTALFRAKLNPRVAQELLGHADLTTTQRYAHVEACDLRQGIAELSAFMARHAPVEPPPESGPRLVGKPAEVAV
jgi:integrase